MSFGLRTSEGLGCRFWPRCSAMNLVKHLFSSGPFTSHSLRFQKHISGGLLSLQKYWDQDEKLLYKVRKHSLLIAYHGGFEFLMNIRTTASHDFGKAVHLLFIKTYTCSRDGKLKKTETCSAWTQAPRIPQLQLSYSRYSFQKLVDFITNRSLRVIKSK